MALTWRDRILLGAPFIGVMLLIVFAPTDDGPTMCPFAICTGTACPGCGLTRAASSLIRGDFGQAMAYHPLVPLIIMEAVIWWGWFVLRKRGRAQPMRSRLLNVALTATAVALLGVWVFRLLTGTLPTV